MSAVASSALQRAASMWFLTAVAGQWLFVYYISAFYGPTAITGDYAAWDRNTNMTDGYLADDAAGNLFFLAHVLAAAVLTFAGTLLYASWHTYTDRRGEQPTPTYPWADTLSPTLGARFALGRFSTLLDVSYVPTPVPPQTGRKNYVDNDRVSTAVGGEYKFDVFGAALNGRNDTSCMVRITTRGNEATPLMNVPNW